MSVHRRKSGWEVRWRQDGKQRSRDFTRRKDAEAWDAEVKRRRQLGPLALQQLTTRGPTLGEWIAQRWAPEHGTTLAQRTRDRYASSYELHIAPWLDDVPLRELTVSRLRAWQAERLADGASGHTVNHARTFLSSVLRHAAESEVIPGNPLALVRAPRLEHTDEVTALAPGTIEAIRSAVADPLPSRVGDGTRSGRPRRAYDMPDQRDAVTCARDATLVAVLAYTGIRPSESSALRWSDVGERTILVQRATNEDGSIKSTKGRKSRSVRLLTPVASDLREWRRTAGRPPGDSLVFPRPDGDAWTKEDWGNWRGRTWRRACDHAGLVETPRPYDLRHSFASLLLAEGRNVHYVAGQLGHSAMLTLNTYGHVLAEFDHADRISAEVEIRRAREAQNRGRGLGRGL